MAGMNSYYNNAASYSVSVQHALFDTYTAAKASKVYKGYMKKQGSSYHSELLGLETVQNARYKIVIDTAGHRVLVSNPDPEPAFTAASFTIPQLEQVLKRCTTVQKGEQGGNDHYKLNFDASIPFAAIVLVLDRKNQSLQKIIFYHQAEARAGTAKDAPKTRPRTEIAFSNFRSAPKLGAKEFSGQAYIREDGKKAYANCCIQPFPAHQPYTSTQLTHKLLSDYLCTRIPNVILLKHWARAWYFSWACCLHAQPSCPR